MNLPIIYLQLIVDDRLTNIREHLLVQGNIHCMGKFRELGEVIFLK